MRRPPELGIMRRFERATHEAISQGGSLSLDEIDAILARLNHESADRQDRLRILGSSIVTAAVRLKQKLWFIENEPWTSLGTSGFTPAESQQLTDAGALWDRALARYPDNIQVLENAVWFYAHFEPERGARLLEERLSVDSPTDPDIAELAAIFFGFLARLLPDSSHRWTLRSADAAYLSFSLDPAPLQRIDLILYVRPALMRLERTEDVRLIDLATSIHRSATAGQGPESLHASALSVCLIALAWHDHERALRYMSLALAVTHSSSHLNEVLAMLSVQELREPFATAIYEAAKNHRETAERLASLL